MLTREHLLRVQADFNQKYQEFKAKHTAEALTKVQLKLMICMTIGNMDSFTIEDFKALVAAANMLTLRMSVEDIEAQVLKDECEA